IDDQLKFRRLHHRQVLGLCALEDATNIGADLTIRIGKVASVTHQPASFGIISPGIGCWYCKSGREDGKVHTSAVEKKIGADKEGIDPLAHKVGKRRVDLAAGACVEDLDLQSEGGGSRLHIFHR